MKLESQIGCSEEGLGPVGAGSSVFDAGPAAVSASPTAVGAGLGSLALVLLIVAQILAPWRRSR